MNRKVAVVMGSDSDFAVMKTMIPVLRENNVDYDFRVISAHRTPEIATEFAKNARQNGYDLIVAGAGMSAHLAGVMAACTGVPIIGVPILSDASGMDGMDALHSVIQMPPGIPVATVGIDQAAGAARLAVKMIGGAQVAEGAQCVLLLTNGATGAADVEKTAKVLDAYGIRWVAADINGAVNDGASVMINLSDASVAGLASFRSSAAGAVVIEVLRKAATNGFNDTSDKVYQQTQAADGIAFAGVHAYQNAAHMAARVFGIHSPQMYGLVVSEHAKLAAAVIEKDAKLRKEVDEGKRLD